MSSDNKNATVVESKPLNSVEGNDYYIYGVFDEQLSRNFVPQLIKSIEEQSKLRGGKITFYIDSIGGYTTCLFSLLSLIEKAKKAGIIVETNVLGRAYSCGSILAASGTKGHRFIGEHAEHICHLGSGYVFAANDKELERGSRRLKTHFNNIRKLYTKYAKIKNLVEVLKHDDFSLRGREIIRNGLADKVI